VPVKIENCKLDLARHTFVDGRGREVRLTRAEAALLTTFVRSPRRVLSRNQLRYAVAGRGVERYDRSVDMLVARLRHKIEPDPKAPRFILSVPGVGYKFDVRPQSAADGEARGKMYMISTAMETHAIKRRMPRRKLFKKGKNLNLLLSAETVKRLDRLVAEGETRTDFVRDAIQLLIERREAEKAKGNNA
jgi:DNA-binding winged helix-turn-helix (wHTH) protein